MATSRSGLVRASGTFLSVGPLINSIFLAALCSVAAQMVSASEAFNPAAIYGGIFNLLTVFTGFLATFYVFIVTKNNEFLKRIAKTETYKDAVRLLKFTVFWSSVVIFLSFLMMVWDPKCFALFSMTHLAVFFWLLNVFMVAVNFARCANQFIMIVDTDDRAG
ncbi:hypothetical protein [Roseobacter sp. S98]|uniref:hypothetical protein n=1 Tax=Roseobacter algicola (ex Choi et al. 2025) (nom. illeg.) TaxID=3092138 RepID=UPI0035C70243